MMGWIDPKPFKKLPLAIINTLSYESVVVRLGFSPMAVRAAMQTLPQRVWFLGILPFTSNHTPTKQWPNGHVKKRKAEWPQKKRRAKLPRKERSNGHSRKEGQNGQETKRMTEWPRKEKKGRMATVEKEGTN